MNQSTAKFAIKTGVVIFELVKWCEMTKFNNYDGSILLILEKHSINSNIDCRQLCCLDLSAYLVLKVAIELNY